MMARTQITLDPEVQRRVRQRAGELDVSLAEYIRRLVLRDLGTPERQAGAEAVFNLGASGGSDVARHKDAMIAAAFARTRQRRRRKT